MGETCCHEEVFSDNVSSERKPLIRTSDTCTSILNCLALSRLIQLLDLYKLIESTNYDILISHFNREKYPHLINDYNHVMDIHLNDSKLDAMAITDNFNKIYNDSIPNSLKKCELNRCKQMHFANNSNLIIANNDCNDTTSDEFQLFVDTLDIIHHFLIHTPSLDAVTVQSCLELQRSRFLSLKTRRLNALNAAIDGGDMEVMNGEDSSSEDFKIETENQENSEKEKRLRSRAIEELVSSEETYIGHLSQLMDSSQSVRAFCDSNLIFPSNLCSIHAMHLRLFSDLAATTKDWSNDTSLIGHIFIRYGELFKMYESYMVAHENCIGNLQKLSNSNAKFAKWAIEQSAQFSGLTIQALLIVPIQRLPRYELLLKEIIGRTRAYHPDLYDLHNAYDQICEVTQSINEHLRTNDAKFAVGMIQSQLVDVCTEFDGKICIPSRLFIADSNRITIYKHSRNGQTTAVVLFLFNDCLIYSMKKRNKNVYKFGWLFEFENGMFAMESVESVEMENNKMQNCLKIFGYKHSVWISFSSESEKEKWMDLVSDQLQSQKLKKSISVPSVSKNIHLPFPVFVPMDFTDKCMECDTAFNKLDLRKKHCGFCGLLMCYKCLTNKSENIWKLEFENKKEIIKICAQCSIEREVYFKNRLHQITSDHGSGNEMQQSTSFDAAIQYQSTNKRIHDRRSTIAKKKKIKQISEESQELN